MSRFFRLLTVISIPILFGAGCEYVPPYRLGEVPTASQLARMSPEEKAAGMRAMLEREPAPAFDEAASRAAMAVAIETVKNGLPERFAEFQSAFLHEATGSVRIVREGEKLYVVLSEDFSVTSGPRLVVRVSGREIGSLVSTQGAQTYEIPDGIALESIDDVDVYCEPFHVVFARARFGN